MLTVSLLSVRARHLRDWVLFALAALTPAFAVGWFAMRAVRGQQDATRREIDSALEAVAERTARSAREQVDEATIRLSRVELDADPDVCGRVVRSLAPRFADAIVVSATGTLLLPAPPSRGAPISRAPAAPECAALSSELVKAPAPAIRERFLQHCAEAKTPTGRWSWPIIALRSQPNPDPATFSTWIESHAAEMTLAERELTRDEAMGAPWLRGPHRERVLLALAASAPAHDSLVRALESGRAASSLRSGPDASGFIRWNEGLSSGILRARTDGSYAGFVMHRSSVAAALRDPGWPQLPPEYSVAVVTGEQMTQQRPYASVATLTPGLGLRIGLVDPGLPGRQAERDRLIMIGAGVAAVILAFALAAMLFGRMRAARRLSELRTGFVSTVSHELRTPIASVRMLAELLEQDRVDEDEKPEVHAALAREAARLGETVDRLLGFSRMAAGRYVIQREQQSVVDVVAQSVDTFDERHPDKGPVVRRLPDELLAFMDGSQLRLALDNLLENASKYAPDGTPYEVRLLEDRGDVVLEVADHGPGIPRRDRRRLFRPFERGDDRLSSGVQGSGIGLSLVHHVAKAHGGAVSVAEEPGGGACFRMRFPGGVATPQGGSNEA